VLEDLDIVVASLHTSLRQERDKITARLIHAIQNRHVDVIGHPTGRMLPDREGADLDMEAVLRAAAEYGVALEVNANPQRLDLDGVYVKRALELGCLLAIDTDSHHPEHFNFAHFGVGTARRGWATAEDVINCWPVERLLQWLDDRGHRRPRVNHHVPEIVAAPAAEAKKLPVEKRLPPARAASTRKRPAAKPANGKTVRTKKPAQTSSAKKTAKPKRR
jgi:hypothetical protein